MQLMKWSVLGAAVLMASDVAAQTPTAQAVVDRYVEAIGGRARIEAVQSRRLVYEMNANGMSMSMEVRQTRPNLAASTIQTPMGEVRSGFDGETVYAVSPMGSQVLEGAQADEVRARAAFDADVTFAGYDAMEVTGRGEHGGRPCWNVRMSVAGMAEATRCFDVETGLVLAITQTQGGTQVTALVEEYREFDGIRYPARTVADAMGQTVVTTLQTVDHSPIPASEFAVPAGVR